MAPAVENLVLEHLREIRERLTRIEGSIDDLKVGQQSIEGVLFALGGYIRGIDTRVEHIEQKLGIDG